MNKTSIKELKSFLIRRLIIVTVIVAAAEAVIMLPVRGVLLPIAARLSQIEALNANASASFDLQDLSSLTLIILQNIF